MYDNSKDIQYLKSDMLEFYVITPANKESLNLINLRDIYKIKNTSAVEKELQINAYKKFLENISFNSVYFEQTFYLYSASKAMTGINYDGTFINECINFINHYPNSYYTNSIVYILTDALLKFNGNKNEILNILDGIRKNNYNTSASTEIEKIINKKLKNFGSTKSK